MLWTEKQHVLREILEKWRDPCRLLMMALYFEERSYEETAELLGVSPEGIGARRSRCIERLREMLSRRGINESLRVRKIFCTFGAAPDLY
jgi:RNA polymerase sigma factor (sigma-70 family)